MIVPTCVFRHVITMRKINRSKQGGSFWFRTINSIIFLEFFWHFPIRLKLKPRPINNFKKLEKVIATYLSSRNSCVAIETRVSPRRSGHEFREKERSELDGRRNRNRCYERNIEDQKGPPPPPHRRGFALLILTRFEFLWTSRGPKPAKTGRFTLTTRHTTRVSPRNTETAAAAANFSDNSCRSRFILAIIYIYIYSFHLYTPFNFRLVQSSRFVRLEARTKSKRSIDIRNLMESIDILL